jgi:hypothetical protein
MNTNAIYSIRPLYLILYFGLTVVLLNACTTAAPVDDSSSSSSSEQNTKVSTEKVAELSLVSDIEALKDSVFVALSKDAKDLELWEKSEAWIKLYQGQNDEAIQAFNTEIKAQGQVHPAINIGKVRAQLELAISYQHLSIINRFLIPSWLTYERSRPNSDLHAQWYQLIEILFLSQSSDPKDQKAYEALLKQAKASPELSEWLDFLLEKGSSPKTAKIESQYRRWLSFVTLSDTNELDKASKKLSKSKPNGHIFTASGQGKIPDLQVFDPRIPQSLQNHYAQAVLQACSKLTFGSYYCGRAYEILGDSKQALSNYKNALKEHKDLLAKASQNYIEHVLLSTHSSFKGFADEIKARIKQLEFQHNLGSKSKEANPKQAIESPATSQAELSPDSKTSSELSSESEATTSELLWLAYAQEPTQNLPQLFPQRRRALGQAFSKALEEAKGPQLSYVASLGLGDRWLDELHYHYAALLVK